MTAASTLSNICFKTNRVTLLILFFFSLNYQFAHGAGKTSVASGNWSSPATWSPSGVPSATDDVIIAATHTVIIDNNFSAGTISVSSNGELKIAAAKMLTLNGTLTVNGKMSMNGGDITLTQPTDFNLGPNSVFTWEPLTNSTAGASLLISGIEHFDASSTLIIKKWYDYSNVPLASVITGDFGDVTLNSISNGILYEWNQNNQFESHKIRGALTIDQGWIVLDKSGAISNTTIGKINLTTGNAYLDFHNGNHSGSFTVNTSSITNTGGNINGIYNGNGNITLNVTGDFNNLGNVVLIYNTGVFSVGNGNATLKVNGEYSQSAGDFRGIFNLTTLNAGTSDLTFNNVTLTGGIMLGHYACHTSSAVCNFKVNGNLNINFSNATDKFRVVGLTSLTGIYNNIKSNLTINGNLSIAGNMSGEFTSSGSVGVETVSIGGNTTISGGNNNFNMGSHQLNYNCTGDLSISGGTYAFSKTPGSATIHIGGNYLQSGGTALVKGHSGTAGITFLKNFSQTSGTFLMHSNSNTVSTDLASAIINGNFNQTGGTINFDDNASATNINSISLKGADYTIGGNGVIMHAAAASSASHGLLRFARSGAINFRRNAISHVIKQVKQVIDNGCIVDVSSGNLQVSSRVSSSLDEFKILSGGILHMNNSKIISNQLNTNSGITIENNGRLSTNHLKGLYNGTDDACISSVGNMNFYLAPASVIEYSGTGNQIVTGTGAGVATTNNHKYGILEINHHGNTVSENAYLTSSTVFVRSALLLTAGDLNLNNNTITVENGIATAISRVSGHVISETNAANNKAIIKWMNMNNEMHVFPFGTTTGEYIPVSFTPISGMGGSVSISTRASGPDNLPFPNNGIVAPVTNLLRNGISAANSSVVDRWFDITATGFKANVIVSYCGAENTTDNTDIDGTFSIQSWDGTKWGTSLGSGVKVKTGIGTVKATNVSSFNYWIISTTIAGQPAANTLILTSQLSDKNVLLDWTVSDAQPVNHFTIERSTDNIYFSEIAKANTDGDNLSFNYEDDAAEDGISYYRIKQVNNDGKIYCSNIEKVNRDIKMQGFAFISIFPNPFKDHFTVSFNASASTVTELIISGANGQIIRTERINSVDGQNTYEYLEKQNLPQGIYVVTLKNGGNAITKKIFKF